MGALDCEFEHLEMATPALAKMASTLRWVLQRRLLLPQDSGVKEQLVLYLLLLWRGYKAAMLCIKLIELSYVQDVMTPILSGMPLVVGR